MMAKIKNIRVKLNRKAVREMILKGDGVGPCQGMAAKIAGEAGKGYATRPVVHPERTGYMVYPATPEAKRDNFENNTLEKLRAKYTK